MTKLQFPEHANGEKSGNNRVRKLDNLAKMLNVTIHIDGIAYGKTDDEVENSTVDENNETQVDEIVDENEIVDETNYEEPEDLTETPVSENVAPRRRRRPSSNC